jgi:hypothetical protein
MNLLKMIGQIMVIGCVAVAAFTIVGKVRQRTAGSGSSAGATAGAGDKVSDAGFFLLSKDDAANNTVIVMCAPNCPRIESQRAHALGDSLASAGIPYELRSEIGFTFHDPDDMARVQKYMENVTNPLVLIRGRAKGNPTFDEVVAEYRGGK